MNKKKCIDKLGEEKSANYLESNNYEILKRNYSCKFGEIDIIALDKNTKELVFIEVKTRTSLSYGMPIEAINNKKINHIKKTINYYLTSKKIYEYDIRIDAIEVFIKRKICYIHHLKRIL